MDLTPLLTTFGIIALAELGDKTQLAAITLSCRYRGPPVFIGAMLAVLIVDGLSILAGTALADLLPLQLLKITGAAIFILFGIRTLVLKDDEKVCFKEGQSALLTSFSMVALMELGDKTQFSIIALAVKYNSPLLVFAGMSVAFALLMGVGFSIGQKLMCLLPRRYLKIITGGVFLIFGMLFLI
ncbi:MAG: TMEM165/GDT1 family protein [Candidatus Hadarchaeum sp.]|uniref:TMEM165/GDT1 family protein n=1 Tax=Candidatus Hadarchaeum sp. TaxID=2883567 RepID=UPI003D13A6BE